MRNVDGDMVLVLYTLSDDGLYMLQNFLTCLLMFKS